MQLENILYIISHHEHLAYLVIFLIAFSESLALIGLLVPGSILMFGVGALIATGVLSLKATLLIAMAGAISGDGISFWLGRYYEDRLKGLWPFNRHPQMMARGESFFRRHGRKSILFGRFVGPVRPVIPVVAGMMGMAPGRFALVNILSAIGWAFAYVLPGVFFGASLKVAGAVSARLALLLFFVAGILWLFIRLCSKAIHFIENRGRLWIASLERWAASTASDGGVKRFFQHSISVLFLSHKGEEDIFIFFVLLFFLAGWGFWGVLQDVVMQDSLVRADQAVYHFLQTLRNPLGDHIFVIIMEMGDGFVTVFLAGSVLAVLLVGRSYRSSAYWFAVLVGGTAITLVFHWSLNLPRSVPLSTEVSWWGFLNGKITGVVIIYAFPAILLTRIPGNPFRWVPVGAVALISFMIAFSFLCLGVYRLSDALGGLFLGWAWMALGAIGYLRIRSEAKPKRALAVAPLAVLLVLGPWQVVHQMNQDLSFYRPHRDLVAMNRRAWLKGGWNDLPGWRIDLKGEREQPLTFQYAGEPESLAQYLISKGWRIAPAIKVQAFLEMLSPDARADNLPLLPRLHDGRFEKILLFRNQGDRRWVFRLWPTDFRLDERGEPLFIGTVETQIVRRISGLIRLPGDEGDYIRSVEILSHSLQGSFQIYGVYRKGAEIYKRNKSDELVWDGMTLLSMQEFR